MNDKIIRVLKDSKLAVNLYQKLMRYIEQSTVSAGIAEVSGVNYRGITQHMDKIRINLLIPSLSIKHVFGGIATALSFYKTLCDSIDCDCRVIVLDDTIDPKQMVEMDGFKVVDWKENKFRGKQLLDFQFRNKKTLLVGDRDVFMATAWWSAYIIQPVIKWQESYYHIKQKPLIYFIQDFEPGFYPWSSRYLMAESTYKMDIDVLAIFNSKLLADFFGENGYNFYRSWFFEPTLNTNLKKYLENLESLPKRKKQILIYGRPGTARNAFELIIESLREWAKIQENVDEWNVVSAGETFPEISLTNKVKVCSLGKLSLEEYAQVMLESRIGISLMVSPHPSYPPLEMSTFGMKVITNVFENKNLQSFNKNIISLSDCSASNIANVLNQLCGNEINEIQSCNHFSTNLEEYWTRIIIEIVDILKTHK